jgi:hypothetical protein
MAATKCKFCNVKIVGRIDKIYCSLDCKNKDAYQKRQNTRSVTKEIDGFLHRNREILDTLMGNAKKESFDRLVLARTGFKFDYFTGIYLNKELKTYYLVYDFAWMEFSDQKILVVKKSK